MMSNISNQNEDCESNVSSDCEELEEPEETPLPATLDKALPAPPELRELRHVMTFNAYSRNTLWLSVQLCTRTGV